MLKLRERALEVFAQAREMPGYTVDWEDHSKNVARVAETIARAINQKKQIEKTGAEMDVDLAFACGLLHDMGRLVMAERVGLRHPILGYELLMREGLEIPARISMTHTYYGYHKINREEFWKELDDLSTKFTKEYMEKTKLEDVDFLVQLADNMGHTLGIMTISDRFCDILTRHNIRSASEHLLELYRLKEYFDKKAGINIYELFKEEILRTTMMEPNGVIGEEQKITDETEDES